MRILAIRGCNLASLAGEFEIDLAGGPLGTAGVFAIVGPTGAGKSTLLDAMCVALFDRTPRLPGHSRVTVGHGEEDPFALGAQDPRTLLRRGASQGWAEVDFESGDARRYRARWSVRRARGAIDGNLQDQQLTLVGLDAASAIRERLGGTKTETLKAIHQRLGLTFDQFRRSALLAQGDFAAFLRAEGKDRSELLERMTGTEIYSKLSIAAHARLGLADQQLRERRTAADAIGVLEPPERDARERELGIATQAREAVRIRLADAERLAHWLAEAATRAAALAEAERAHTIAEAEVRAADPRREELGSRRRAEALRPAWMEAIRMERDHVIATEELAKAAEAVRTAEQATIAVDRTCARVAELHAILRAARIAANIVEVEPTSEIRGVPHGMAVVGVALRRANDGANGRANDSTNDGAGDLPAVEAQAHAALEPARWLVERRALAPEIALWPDFAAKLAQERALAEGIATAARVLADQGARRGVLGAKHVALGVAHEGAQRKLAEAQREAEAFVKRRTLSLDAAGRAEDDARARRAEIDKLVAIATGAQDAAKILAELAVRITELEHAAATDRDRRAATNRERDRAEIQRAERAHQVGELRKAGGFEHARAELVTGEPCPLCGAPDHPWEGRGAFDALIARAEAALGDSAAAWDAATKLLAQLDAREAQREAERVRFASTRATAATSAEALARDWRDQLTALGELILVADPAAPEAARLAGERSDAAKVQLEAARAQRSAAVAAAKATADAQARVQVGRANLDHHIGELAEIAAQLAALDVAVERIAGDRDGKLERHRELTRELAIIADRWTAALPVEEGVMLGLSASRRSTPAPGPDLAHGPVGVGHAADRGADRASDHGAERSVDRAGEPVTVLAPLDRDAFGAFVQAWRERATVVAHGEAALVAALAALDRMRLAGERNAAEATARRTEAARRTVELEVALAEANAALATARVAAGFDRDALHRVLAGDPARIDALAAELEQLARAVDRARTRVSERRRLVDDHAAARPAAAAAHEGDAGCVPELAAAVTSADHRAAALAAMLAADDDARRRRDEALSAFAAAERAVEIDRVLGEVIGSHDGKLFRSFAQSLTLDQLLSVANSHLEELAPRYQLERVPKHDLELQVIDRDFAGEVRSVQSLSGGEGFLVSLALALGLSSMSAHDVRVRTLLIDEGFGTLDPATLDSALAVLDELQATGRQVGVISHVPALLDRVRAHVRVTPRGGGRSDVFVPPS